MHFFCTIENGDSLWRVLRFYSSTTFTPPPLTLVTCMVYCITHPASLDYITTLSMVTCTMIMSWKYMCCAIFVLHNHPLYGHVYDDYVSGFWDFTSPPHLLFHLLTLVTCMVYYITHPPFPDYITTLSMVTCMMIMSWENMCCAIFVVVLCTFHWYKRWIEQSCITSLLRKKPWELILKIAYTIVSLLYCHYCSYK